VQLPLPHLKLKQNLRLCRQAEQKLVPKSRHRCRAAALCLTGYRQAASFQRWAVITDTQDQAALELISHSKDFKKDGMYWAFYHPVSTKEFKSYPKVVSHPKCLEDIVTAIRFNNYETCDAFLSDVMLISSNCEAFSRSGYISYNNDLVLIGWGLFREGNGLFFQQIALCSRVIGLQAVERTTACAVQNSRARLQRAVVHIQG